MLDTIRLNAWLANGLVILKTKGISHYKKCDYCGDTLSKFSIIKIQNFDDACEIMGKQCPTCNLIYVSGKMPDGITRELEDTFGSLVQVYDNQYGPKRTNIKEGEG